MLKKKLKKAISVFQWLLTAVLVLVVLLLIFTAFNPIKSFQVLRVMSGSMEPKIKVGSVVFIQKINPENLKKNDIITYASEENPDMLVTHRLVEIEEKENQTVFKTKGDANNSKDMAEVSPSQIKGKVVFSLPFLGYLSIWIRKPAGFGLLVILPAILIIISEILNIKKTIEKEVEKKYAKQEKHSKSKIVSLLLIFFLLGISFPQIKATNAYFSDVAVVEGNTFSMADDWTAPVISNVNYLIETPGEPNKMGSTLAWSNLPSFEETGEIPQIDFYLEKEKTAVGFRVINISQYSNLDYQILYETSGIEKGLGSTITLGGENEISRNGLVLGTCSKGVCVYDKGMAEIRLNIKLTNKDGKEISLDKSIKL